MEILRRLFEESLLALLLQQLGGHFLRITKLLMVILIKFSLSLLEIIDHDIKDKGEYQFTSALEGLRKKGAVLTTGQVTEWLDCGNKNITVQTNRK